MTAADQQQPAHSAAADRWRLHRGGVINIWEFAERTFDYSGGRVIFQGANGSGKSRTLELQMPLPLDGDLHNLGAKGHGSVSVRRLMLDQHTGGSNRIGYSWLELRRSRPDGTEEFLTCGIGVKASRTTQQVAASWRFCTPLRVGYDLHLLGVDDVPLDAGELRRAVGEEHVFGTEDERFQSRVASLVYGIDEHRRYLDLLNLQRTLRNPDIGLKAVEGQLERYLSDALPPLDPELVRGLAEKFHDLESIRENITRLTATDAALTRFLSTYRGYVRGELVTRATALRAARRAKATQDRAMRAATDRLAELDAAHDAALAHSRDLENREGELAAEIGQLRLPEELRDIQARQAEVDRLGEVAQGLLDLAAAGRDREHAAAEAVTVALRGLDRLCSAATAQLSTVGTEPHGAVPRLPVVPGPAEETGQPVTVRTGLDPEHGLAQLSRPALVEVDPDRLEAGFADCLSQASAAATATRERAALLRQLAAEATELAGADSQLARYRAAAAEADREAEQAGEAHRAAQTGLRTAADQWLAAAAAWVRACPTAQEEPAATDPATTGAASPVTVPAPRALPEPPPPAPALPEADRLLAEPAAVEEFARLAVEWATPRAHAAQQQSAAAAAERDRLAVRASVVGEELAALRAGGEPRPQRPEHATAERDQRAGAPFYRLVEFVPGLDPEQQAGLEAALQASGLLNAWVGVDGKLQEPDLHDVVALAPAGPGRGLAAGGSLADLLVPSDEAAGADGAGVSTEVVASLLGAIRLDQLAEAPEPGTGLAVSTTGRWRAGVLGGAWSKPYPEYVGERARAAASGRRVVELTDLLERLEQAQRIAAARASEAGARATRWQHHLRALPGPDALVVAAGQCEAEQARHRRLTRTASERHQVHQDAHGRWRAERNRLYQRSVEAGLAGAAVSSEPAAEATDAATLSAAALAAERAVSVLAGPAGLASTLTDQYRPALAELRTALRTQQPAVAERAQREARAEAAFDRYQQEKRALGALSATLGSDADQQRRHLTGLRAEYERIRAELPEAREAVRSAIGAQATARAALEQQRARSGERQETLVDAEDAFTDAVEVPGLWLAVTGRTETPPTDRDEVLALLEQAVNAAAVDAPSADKTDVINQQQVLRGALAADRDVVATEHAGILTVTLTDEEGRRPVADFAARCAQRLAAERAHLGEEYRAVLEDYLLHDLADHLRVQIDQAEALTGRMNEILSGAQSSQGVHVQLSWKPAASQDESVRQALPLVRKPLAARSAEEDGALRAALRARIEAEWDAATSGSAGSTGSTDYAAVLAGALDYRNWFAFTVHVQDTGPDGQPRRRLLRRLSSGETRLVSYVTLFATAASFYDALAAEGAGPLRVVLLDEAFERLDAPTITRLLELLVELDMDWIITWPGGSPLSPRIPRLQVYDVLKRAGAPGVAFVQTTWEAGGASGV